MKQPSITARSSKSNSASLDLDAYPYLQRFEKLRHTYPALKSALDKLRNSGDPGRVLVSQRYSNDGVYQGTPGRCAVLTFGTSRVDREGTFESADALDAYLKSNPADHGKTSRRRLFILEDTEPKFVDRLGERLGVDPLVFSSQMNTWNFTDSKSVPHRALPSLQTPAKSFTLRYYELRTLDDEDNISITKNQMTHAVNRRIIERWRDVDTKSIPVDKRHAFVRRCASFWCSTDDLGNQSSGWDAVILVDPPMDSCATCKRHNEETHRRDKSHAQIELEGKPDGPQRVPDRQKLWNAQSWADGVKLREARHNSVPYHGGCPSIALSHDKNLAQHPRSTALLDEIVFHWTSRTNETLVKKAYEQPVNAAYHLLKFVAQHWNHQLELITYGVSISEWFADDHDATMDPRASLQDWKTELQSISQVTKDINYTRRQMAQFERAITLNIERLGVQLGCEAIDTSLPLSLADAQKDFLAILRRLRPLRERVDDLSNIASNVTSLRAAFKGLQDGEQGLKLNLFAAIIFPLTLVASMFSMAEGYLPGQRNFWVFWAASIPLAFVVGFGLLYSHFSRVGRSMLENNLKRRQEKALEQRAARRGANSFAV
ncbi:hypothetical protein FKW77_001366 [Lecanosticta acicola]|uniref:Uncharacterized protein n=1 Tax=Lecanosticta acicola TaxID=111012 RepID=A0AAI8YSD0_9PEZI|nr:hypothetical protein FKW77_001366 [Lecanosticta acicola]